MGDDEPANPCLECAPGWGGDHDGEYDTAEDLIVDDDGSVECPRCGWSQEGWWPSEPGWYWIRFTDEFEPRWGWEPARFDPSADAPWKFVDDDSEYGSTAYSPAAVARNPVPRFFRVGPKIDPPPEAATASP